MSSNILKTIQNVGGVMQEREKLTAQKFQNGHRQIKSFGRVQSNTQNLRIVEENAAENKNDLAANNHINNLRYSGLLGQETGFEHNEQFFAPNSTKQFSMSPKSYLKRKLDLPPLNALKIQKVNESFSPSRLKKKGHTLSENLVFNIQPHSTTTNTLSSNNLTNQQILFSPVKKSSKPIFKVKSVSENSNGYFKLYTNPLKVKSSVELLEDQPKDMRELNQLLKPNQKLEQKQNKQDQTQKKDISFINTTEASPLGKQLTLAPYQTKLLPIENEICEDLPEDDSLNDIQELQENGLDLTQQQDKYQEELSSFHQSEQDNPLYSMSPSTKINSQKLKKQDFSSKRTSFLSNASNLLDYSEISPSKTSAEDQKNSNKPYGFLQQLKKDFQNKFLMQSQQNKTRDGFFNVPRQTSTKPSFSPTKQHIQEQYSEDISFNSNETECQGFCNCQYALQQYSSSNSPTKKISSNYQQLNRNQSQAIRLFVKKPKTLQVICPSNDYSKNRQYKKHHSSSAAFNPKDYIAI